MPLLLQLSQKSLPEGSKALDHNPCCYSATSAHLFTTDGAGCVHSSDLLITLFAIDKLFPKRADRLREFVRAISTKSKENDSDEVELTHDQLMDEDVDFDANSCDYFEATGDTEMTLLKM